MITTRFHKGQGLGNQLWCYAVTRAITLDHGYDFGIVNPENFIGTSFMPIDFGKTPTGINNFYQEKQTRHPKNGADISDYDARLVGVADNTEIKGVMQDEQYIAKHKEEIKSWFKIQEKYECNDYASDSICVINFRGGEYLGYRELFLTQKYWEDCINYMRSINPNLTFVVVTDDKKTARRFFSDFEIIHESIGKDFSIIKNAHYLIISNSSFAWFPAWLNENLKLCLAPKYWARHNVSDGYWSPGYSITSTFKYMDRNGIVSDYTDCLAEMQKYRESNHKDTSSIQKQKINAWYLLAVFKTKLTLSFKRLLQ